MSESMWMCVYVYADALTYTRAHMHAKIYNKHNLLGRFLLLYTRFQGSLFYSEQTLKGPFLEKANSPPSSLRG